MAHFKLDLLTPVVSQDTESNNRDVYFLKDTITDFYSQSLDINNTTHSFSYDEKFSCHINAQKELTFSMYRKVWQGDNWILNPFISSIHVGSTILLTTKDGREHMMTVKNIALKFSAINISYQYTCQDSFSYQLSRQNDGYTLDNDPSSDTFIGARTVDYWIQEHIAPDCYIAYEYIPLNKGVALYNSNHTRAFESQDSLTNIKEIIKPVYSDPAFYETILFSCSGSNGNAALIALAEQLGLMVNVYEHLSWHNTRWVATKYFWLEPVKHNEFNGIYYSPNNSIQSFGLSFAGDSLTTVLNVQSTDIGEETIGLFPSVPGFFVNYFASVDWSASKYYPGMFLDLLQGEYWRCDGSLTDTIVVGSWRKDIAMNGNFYCGYQILPKAQQLTVPRWYSKCRFYWGDNITSFDEINGYGSKLYLYIEQELEETTRVYLVAADEELPLELLGKTCNIWVVYRQPEVSRESINKTIYIYWYRDVTDEEYAFAEMADKCPWLENKLIDFTYFIDQKILSPNEYLILSNFINNNVRIINGQLMAHSQAYYTALHKQTATLAELTNQLDLLGATCQADILTPYATLGKVKDSSQFINAYNNFFRTFDAFKPIQLLNRTELLSNYLSKYFNADQRFLKNIKNFRDYFEMANAFASRPGACIAQDQLSITPTDDFYTLSFEPLAFTSVFKVTENNAGEWVREYKESIRDDNEPLVQFYRSINDSYEPIVVASPSNIQKGLIYIPRDVAGSLKAVEDNHEYSDNIDYFVDIDTYQDWIFDYSDANTDLKSEIRDIYKDRELVQNGKTYIRLERSDLIKLYISQHSNKYYIKDTERLIPLDWIRYDKSGWETDEPDGALKGVNPAVIPHEDRGDSSYWRDNRPGLENPVTDNFQDVEAPDDKWDAWASYRFSFGLSNLYYYGKKHKLTTTYDNTNQAQHTIERINEKGWTATEYQEQWRQFKKEHPEATTWSIQEPTNYLAFQPMSFYSALPTGYGEVKEFSSDDYRQWRAECTKDFNYFSFAPNAAMLGWGIGLICGGGVSGFGMFGSVLLGWIGIVAGAIMGAGLIGGAFMEENSQWVNQYQANRYFTPTADWKHLLFKTTTDEWTAPINFEYENKMITSLKLYDSYSAIYAKTATAMQENIEYSQALKSNFKPGVDPWDYVNYYNLLTATYSFEIDGNKPYYSEDFEYNKKNTNAAYDEITDKPNAEYKFWIKNRYYRLIGHEDNIARTEKYKLLILNSGDQTTFTGPIQWNPGFTTELPTRFSAIQFGFFESGGFINVDLEANDDLWRHKDNNTETISTSLPATTVFSGWEATVEDLATNLPGWDAGYYKYLWKRFLGHKLIYFLLVHEENYEKGIITTTTKYQNWDNYTVNYKDININDIYRCDSDARAHILEELDLFQFENFTVLYRVKEDTNFRQAEISDWNANKSYYYQVTDQYIKTYSLDEWLNQTETLYMQNGLELLVTNFEQNAKTFEVTFYLQRRELDATGGYVRSYIRYPNLHHLDFSQSDTCDISIWYNDIEYKSTITLENDVNPTSLQAMSNGEFWYRYHQQTEWPMILEQCAIIEAELTMWWNAAKTASKYCEYFLPDSWLPTVDNSQNYFAKDIWQLKYKNTGKEDNSTSDLVSVGLSNKYVPIVHIYSERDSQGVPQTYLPAYRLTYNPTIVNTGFAAIEVLGKNPAYEACKVALLSDGWNGWSVEETGKCTYYYVDPVRNSGTKWKDLIRTISNTSTTYELYNGLYAMQFYVLWNYYTNSPLTTYEKLLKEKLGLWQYLYSLYPNVLLEGSYKNEQASSSAQLYKEAQLAFKDKMHPEKQYNITIMDMNRVVGDRSLFRIGEPIAINAQEYYDEPDDVFQALSQFLFITDISYTLRNDADIQLTVNSIKYQEKLLQQLVKLIR